MSKIIKREELLKKLNNIPDFVNEYSIDINSIHGSTKKAKFYHKNCSQYFDMMIKSFIGSPSSPGHRCPYCAATRRIISNTKNITIKKEKRNNRPFKDLEYYINKINQVRGYKFLELADIYHGSNTKVKILHEECNSIFIKRISDFVYNKQYCPNCVENTRIKDYKIAYKNFDDHGFILLDKKFKGTHAKSKIKCKHCGEILEKSYNTIVNLNGKCFCQKTKYKGETIIKKYLTKNDISFIQGKTFDDLAYNAPLRLDFFIPSMNVIIEYDGVQHFKRNIFYHDNLNDIRTRDLIKNNYAKEKNINIIRISYKENTLNEITKILNYLLFNKLIDGKPYDGKLSRTVWVGGKSDYEEYIKYNS